MIKMTGQTVDGEVKWLKPKHPTTPHSWMAGSLLPSDRRLGHQITSRAGAFSLKHHILPPLGLPEIQK
jgi:hypothetical protein